MQARTLLECLAALAFGATDDTDTNTATPFVTTRPRILWKLKATAWPLLPLHELGLTMTPVVSQAPDTPASPSAVYVDARSSLSPLLYCWSLRLTFRALDLVLLLFIVSLFLCFFVVIVANVINVIVVFLFYNCHLMVFSIFFYGNATGIAFSAPTRRAAPRAGAPLPPPTLPQTPTPTCFGLAGGCPVNRPFSRASPASRYPCGRGSCQGLVAPQPPRPRPRPRLRRHRCRHLISVVSLSRIVVSTRRTNRCCWGCRYSVYRFSPTKKTWRTALSMRVRGAFC